MDTASSPSFATLLRRHRLATGLTQEELAERANLSVRAVSDLERGLRKAPRKETIDLLTEALELSPRDRAQVEAATARRRGPAASRRTQSLPAELTSLIGRERETAQAVHALRWDRVRLLTLTGPGGVGKTRLAIRVARSVADDFSDGVAFVPLASITDAALVPLSLAASLGLFEQGGQAIEDILVSHLCSQQRLLVLDNFEHLLEAAAFIPRLLAACPDVTALVTSRAPLRVQMEQKMDVPPLAVPVPSALRSPERATRCPSVVLFLERARAVKRDFEVTEQTLPFIIEICRALDGLPLAIELAAARTNVLSADMLLGRLDRRLQILTGGLRDLPPRQHTMRNTIAWSYDLLRPAEQTLFRRLSVFAGGCTLEAAEAVCQAIGHLELDILDGLGSLLDKSLLTVREQEGPGEARQPRFGMLETVREFAHDQLLSSSEAEAAHREHARYFLALSEAARTKVRGPDQSTWLERLEQEHDNLRAALNTAHQMDDVGLGLHLAAVLWPFWLARGHFKEAQEWLDRFLPRSEAAGVSPSIRAYALYAAGTLANVHSGNELAISLLRQALVLARLSGDDRCTAAILAQMGGTEGGRGNYQVSEQLLDQSLAIYRRLDDRPGLCAVLSDRAGIARYQGDYERAAALYHEALVLSRAIGDTRRVAYVLARLGNLATDQGRPSEALPLYEEALALRRQARDTFGIADVLYRLGSAATDIGDYPGATVCYEESLDLYRSLGNKYGVAYVLLNQTESAIGMGDLEGARALAVQALALFEELGDRRCIAMVLMHLGDVAREQHDYQQAMACYSESLTLHWKLNVRPGIARCLESMTRLACVQGQGERAARLHGAAAALRGALNAVMPPAERARYDQDLAVARGQMDDQAFATGEAEGQAMSVEQVVEYALQGPSGSMCQLTRGACLSMKASGAQTKRSDSGARSSGKPTPTSYVASAESLSEQPRRELSSTHKKT